MSYIDYYQILGIEKKATEKDIKNAYRKLARKYHPDVNPNDKDAQRKFQEVNEANEVLSDPEKRKKYDQYGKDWKHAEQFEQSRQSQQNQHRGNFEQGGFDQGYSGGFEGTDFSDFFSSMFGAAGSGRTRSTQFKGQDFNAELKLNLRDVYTSQKQTITVNGKNIRLTIPAGIENGQTIKIKGHGAPGVNGGPPGDLYITFSIAADPEFRRLGNDLHKTVDLDIYTAILGGDITISTMSGKVKLKVSPETQTGTKAKLKGKGLPVYKKDAEFGDLYITYNIKMPTALSGREKELFTELSKLRKP